MNKRKLLKTKEYPIRKRIRVKYKWNEDYEELYAEIGQIEPYRSSWIDIVFREEDKKVKWHYLWHNLSEKEFMAKTSEPLREEIIKKGIQLYNEQTFHS